MTVSKSRIDLWHILLVLLFLRPFLSEYAFLALGIQYNALLILCALIYLFLNRDKRIFLQFSDLLPVLFIAAILVSILFSGYTVWSLLELYFFIPNIMIFYIVSRIDLRQIESLMKALFFASCILSLYAIYQYFLGIDQTIAYLKRIGYSNEVHMAVLAKKRVFATMISPNIFVSYLAMMLFTGLGLSFSYQRIKKTLYLSGVFLIIAALILTKSIGGFIAFLMILIFFVVLASRDTGIKRIIFKYVVLSFIFICGLFFYKFAGGRITQFLDFNNQNNALVQRLYYWKASFSMIKDYPFFGIGWRKFGLLYEAYKPYPANISHYSHNVFLQIMAETGFLGVAALALLVSNFIKSGLKVIKKDIELRLLKIGLFCAGLFFIIHNLFDLSFYFAQVSFFWWIVLGVFANFNSKNDRLCCKE